jgi:hypothetical protein
MADQTLNDFLSGVRLTELFRSEAIKTGVPDLLPELGRPSGNNPVGTKVQWDEVTGNRQLAVLVHQGSIPRTVDQPGVTRRFATALGTKEEMVIGQDLMYALKQNVPIIADNARRELVRRSQQFRSRMDNLSASLRASVLALGAIYVDSSGNILPTSSGAAASGKGSVDFGVATANKFTKDGAGSTYNIGDWSSASTDVAGKLRALRIANTKSTGYRLSTIYYGSAVPGYLAANTTLTAYWQRNPQLNQKFLDTNEIPDGFLGWKWRPVGEAFFVDQNSATQSWFATNYIGAIPDVTNDWYEYFECGTVVPKGIGAIGSDLDAMLGMVDVVYGLFSYASIDANAICKQTYGWYGLPTIKVPGTVYFGTCS